ncbi:hypothetical protein ATCC90586_001707 [Pythium insidiosum]|nr:hypothetical protein ATCC90586_001707 [Pythium insidiosum]
MASELTLVSALESALVLALVLALALALALAWARALAESLAQAVAELLLARARVLVSMMVSVPGFIYDVLARGHRKLLHDMEGMGASTPVSHVVRELARRIEFNSKDA